MKRVLILSCLLALTTIRASFAQSPTAVNVIPQPNSVTKLGGLFSFGKASKIYYDGNSQDMKAVATQLADRLVRYIGWKIPIVPRLDRIGTGAIVLSIKAGQSNIGTEGYQLVAQGSQVKISANTAQGVFYGTQTLDQLLANGEHTGLGIAVPAVKIVDLPRFPWRGMMLDVGRYFYSVEFIKKYIDYLAMYKMNTFHWHLTEDHGWRIEIKKYPRLTEIGSKRGGTQYDRGTMQIDKNPHWGYYTQEQIREVVAYAQAKFVTVVPEIEMPGHALAALASYPELSCTNGPFQMPILWAIQKDIFCAGNEQTFKFIEDVLTEVVALFPGQYIHIGGDEAPKDRWKACAKCQQRIKAEGLKDEHELQSYFIRRVENFLLTKNKRIIGWDEILEGGLAPNAAVMSWRGVEGGIAAAKLKHEVVMTPSQFLYFDFYQGEPHLEPAAIHGFLPLGKVYHYEPADPKLTAEEAKFIKGVQGNVWAEYIHSPEKVEYMAFPRAAALAEIAWTQPALKNWDSFIARMEHEYSRYEKIGINYAVSAYNVYPTVKVDTVAKKATITFTTDSYRPQIRYTINGNEPTLQSTSYQQPFEVTLPVIIKAANFKNGKRIGKISSRTVVLP